MAISTVAGGGVNPAAAAMRLYSSRPSKNEQLNKSLQATSPNSSSDVASISDEVSISDEARAILSNQAISDTAQADLSKAEIEQIAKLKSRDQEVRSHEQAHLTAAGQYAAGGPSFSTTQGPDGRQYVVEGQVPIDLSPVSGDPQATVAKARTVRQAALAPTSPSSQDQAIAAKAAQLEAQAQRELLEQQQSDSSTGTAKNGSSEINSDVGPEETSSEQSGADAAASITSTENQKTTTSSVSSVSSVGQTSAGSETFSVPPTVEDRAAVSSTATTANENVGSSVAVSTASNNGPAVSPQQSDFAQQVTAAYANAQNSSILDIRI